jgi:DNA-directed RNA polymerase subunit alpha
MDYHISLPSHTYVSSENENKGVYEIEGLYPGYGHTLGNSIRRILLSSLMGAAVTRVQIDGVNHEFSTIPGVVEDVVTILLNVKQLRFQLHGDEPAVATIDVNGVKDISGSDIKCPTQLTMVNTDQHVASVSDKDAKFHAELTVERGLGFVPAEELMKDRVPAGTLVVDAIFGPIRRVNYEIENMRVGDRTDYNRLRLHIETDGTITPRVALENAYKLLQSQFEHISKIGDRTSEIEAMETISLSTEGSVETQAEDALEAFSVSSRIKNALRAAGLSTPSAVSALTNEQLQALDGIGAKAVEDIVLALSDYGLSLKE